jgi:hypothetical protein
VGDNMPSNASAEFSAFADILKSAMTAAPVAASIHEALPPADRTRADRDWRESVDHPSSGETSTRDAAALHQVARSLATAETCMTLLAQSRGGLMTLALGHVLKAEMARATGLVQLLQFLKGDLLPVNSTVFSSAIVRRAVQSAESEGRLRGITLRTRSNPDDLSFIADEALLANVLLGVLLTTFALLDGVQNPQVELVVTVSDQGEIALSVIQEHATAPHGWMTRPAASASAEVAGGVLGAVAMSAGQRIARGWGGRFAVTAAECSTSVSIYLPVIHTPRPSAASASDASQVVDEGRPSLRVEPS